MMSQEPPPTLVLAEMLEEWENEEQSALLAENEDDEVESKLDLCAASAFGIMRRLTIDEATSDEASVLLLPRNSVQSNASKKLLNLSFVYIPTLETQLSFTAP